jgi:Flp pilus assembly protein TadB
VAQARRKRQTKHRGNAAGVVESRGRTGRKPTAAEKRGEQARAKEQRVDRRDKPPTWRGAFVRSMFASVILLVFVAVLLKQPTQGIALFPVVLLLYVPVSYYTDKFMYDRRQRKKAAEGHRGSASTR